MTFLGNVATAATTGTPNAGSAPQQSPLGFGGTGAGQPIPTNPATATAYQNTTGRPIYLHITCLVTTAAGGVVCNVGPASTGLTTVCTLGGSGSGLNQSFGTLIVVPDRWFVSFTITTATVTAVGEN